MICRIFYTDRYDAQRKNKVKVGTKYNIFTLEDLQELCEEFSTPIVFDIKEKNIPTWLYIANDLYKENWLKNLDEDIVEDEFLIEYPDESWLTCQWIEIYNNYRE